MDFEPEELTPEQAKETLQQKLQGVYADLAKMRDEWVRARAASGIESEWRKAQELYDGKSPEDRDTSFESTLRTGPTRRGTREKERNRSKVVVNIVAPKVESQVARMCEILLPVDDKNWGIKPTPDPEMMADAQSGQMITDPQTGQQAPLGEAARAKMDQVRERSDGMARQIDDVLTECGYNGQQREMIRDAGLLGTGILKGPYPTIQRSKVWVPGEGGAQIKQYNEKIQPGSIRVDPWNIFPDPSCGSYHQRGAGIWERRDVTRKELRALVGVPGYDEEAIREVLREAPKRLRVAEGRIIREDAKNETYELWEFHGEVEEEQFGLLSLRTGLEDDEGDPLMVGNGVLVMVQDRIIGALEPWWDDDLPYDFFYWYERDDSPFGRGIPMRMENQQRVVNAAWRRVMDNASHTAGSQIVLLKHLIEPEDGSWEVSPFKTWLGKEELDDVRKAFTVFDFPDRLQNLLAIAQTAMQLADQETNAPLMMQGDQGSAPDTVGGMTMLMNQANSSLRHRVKLFDDQITRPHLKRYYDWFMEHGEDPEIKGDFEVDARGSSTLIERDLQNQAMLNVAQLAQNPVYGPLLQQKAAPSLRALLKSFKLDPDDHCPTDEEIEQNAAKAQESPPPPDPRIESAKIMAQSKQAELQDRQQERLFRAKIEEQNAAERAASIAYNSQREQGEYEIAMSQTQNDRDIAFAKLANERDMSVQDLMAKWKIKALEIDADRQLFNAEAQLKAQMGSGI